MEEQTKGESPTYVRTSTAAAMTIGKLGGRFLRQAQLYCINLLLTYDDGCSANCAYCGLSGSRDAEESWSEQSFIRVDLPTLPLTDVVASLNSGNCSHVERVCISLITNGRSVKDAINVTEGLREATDKISVLVTPTIINKDWLMELKKAGADKIGVAVDAAGFCNAFSGEGIRHAIDSGAAVGHAVESGQEKGGGLLESYAHETRPLKSLAQNTYDFASSLTDEKREDFVKSELSRRFLG